PALNERLQKTRVALSTDDVAKWRPLLDEFQISAVILDQISSPNTYQKLLSSPNWIKFHDDGAVSLFGRADAPPADLAYFRAHRPVATAGRLGALSHPERGVSHPDARGVGTPGGDQADPRERRGDPPDGAQNEPAHDAVLPARGGPERGDRDHAAAAQRSGGP